MTTTTNEAALFVRAVERGIKRGGFKLIRQKRRGYSRYYSPEKVLGEYDYISVRLKLNQAYELYKALSESPLTVKELCTELEAAGLTASIKPSVLTIAGELCKAITIQRGKCAELNSLILGFSL